MDQARVLMALRSAQNLKRAPGPLTPDGREKWHSLIDLTLQGYLPCAGADDMAVLSRAARGLYKLRLVASRTRSTRTRWSLTADGSLWLAGLLERAGVTDVLAAEDRRMQAAYDLGEAEGRLRAAERELAAAYEELGTGVPAALASALAGVPAWQERSERDA